MIQNLRSAGESQALFVGDEMLVVQCAAEARRHGIEPALLASANPLVLDEATAMGIATVDTRTVHLHAGVTAAIGDRQLDVLFSIAYQHIVDVDLLQLVPVAINFHDGLLPAYGGLNVTTWSILAGESTHGVTWHLMDELADRGEIVHEVRFDVGPDATAFSLNAQCYEAGLASFAHVAQAVASPSMLETRPQPDGERRMYRRTERPVLFVDPSIPAGELERQVRALDVGPRAEGFVGSVRIDLGGEVHSVRAARVASGGDGAVGEIRVTEDALAIQTVDGVFEITRLCSSNGDVVSSEAALDQLRSPDRPVLAQPDADALERLRTADPGLARAERRWASILADLRCARPTLSASPGTGISAAPRAAAGIANGVEVGDAIAALAVWIDAVAGPTASGVAVTDVSTRRQLHELPGTRPPIVDLSLAGGGDELNPLRIDLADRVDAALERGVILTDLVSRLPGLDPAALQVAVTMHLAANDADDAVEDDGEGRVGLDFALSDGGRFTVSGFDSDVVERIGGQVRSILTIIDSAAELTTNLVMRDVDVLSDADRAMIARLNSTDVDHDRTATIDALFRRCRDERGEAPALSCAGVTLTYNELGARVEALVQLLRSADVHRGETVGIALERSVDMVVGVLATLTLGAHYLPLDPSYPTDRLAGMVVDSATRVVLARQSTAPDFGPAAANIDFLDPNDAAGRASSNAGVPDAEPVVVGGHGSADLAYIIYTSGSTGAPKGVELEHRQVVNFFVGMDAVVDRADAENPGVWLAATSLSFDISVLEILWTLTRGFHVVVAQSSGFVPPPAGATTDNAAVAPAIQRSIRPATMSLFYFAADERQATNGYQLLLTSARWADAQGFEAVWTPERHFHDFGAPYPNPSVIGAALAATTERIGIRAGSVVIPLHSPIRIAEEWAVVDNLSGGRVGLSFAAGWQPNDFVLNPSAYATARDSLPGLVDTVRELWRGNTVELPGHDGAPVVVATKPRPVQAELPVWITSAGSPQSFARAGTLGHNVLTHLVGQTVERLSENIAVYRAAWTEAGHAGEGQVTLMLHTFLDADGDVARETARQPLKGYLGTAVGLLKDLASSFPTFHRAGADADEAFRSLTDDEMSQLLDLATDRYLSTAGLFGTLDEASALAQSVIDVGVDELACLIDFGIEQDLVLSGLDLLGELHLRLRDGAIASEPEDTAAAPPDTPATQSPGPAPAPAPDSESFAALVQQYGVTHFQCTPSLASMIVADTADRTALSTVRHMMVGGEALPVALAQELRSLLPHRLTNMYGPTETTIWSLVHDIDAAGPLDVASIPIGSPIANTTLHVRDRHGRELPAGVAGELFIGGDGVARGYRNRPELTAERFPASADHGRLYATGDIVVFRPDGIVEFGGRTDNQVKIRGHRIELGEIETLLDAQPGVARSVVIATTGPTPELVAYVSLRTATDNVAAPTPESLRAAITATLPDAMVPSAVALIDRFPLTPNGKIDRNQLPAFVPSTDTPEFVGATNDAEQVIGVLWQEQLGLQVGLDDNFFEVGGHSLMAVKMFRELGADHPSLALTDIFRYPTIRTFAGHMAALDDPGVRREVPTAQPAGTDRAALRRRARNRGGNGGPT